LPDPGIVDQDVDHPETAARLVDDLIDRLVAGEVGLDRHQIGAVLPLLCRLGEFGEALGGAVDRCELEPLAEQAQHKLPADAAGGTRHNRHALLLAHRLLLSLQGCYNRLPPSTGMTSYYVVSQIVGRSERHSDRGFSGRKRAREQQRKSSSPSPGTKGVRIPLAPAGGGLVRT
jgi:hypothetical protein